MTSQFLWAAATGFLLLTGPIAASAQQSDDSEASQESMGQKLEESIDDPGESSTDEGLIPEDIVPENEAIEKAIDDPREKSGDVGIIPQGTEKSKDGAVDQPQESGTDEDVLPRKDLKKTRKKIEKQGREVERESERAIDDPNESPGDEGIVPQRTQDQEPQEAIVPEPTQGRREVNPRNIGLQVGLGLSNYNGNLAENVDPGVGWDMRASFMNTEIVGGELAYSGAANNLEGQDPGRPNTELDGTAITSSGDAMARLNMTRNTALQPFVTAGLGVLSVDFRDDETTVDQGTALTIPVGAGLQVYTPGRLTFGGRFNYRVLTDVIDNDLPSGDNWNLGLTAGATF